MTFPSLEILCMGAFITNWYVELEHFFILLTSEQEQRPGEADKRSGLCWKFPFGQDALFVFSAQPGGLRQGQRVKAAGADETPVNLTGINNSNPFSTLLRWRTVYIFARGGELTEGWRAKATVSSLFCWGIKFLNCVLEGKVVETNKLEIFQLILLRMFQGFSLICHNFSCSYSPAAEDSKCLLFSTGNAEKPESTALKTLPASSWFCGNQVLQINDIKWN